MAQTVTEVYRAFRAANVPDEQAEAAATAVAERDERFVTREYLDAVLEAKLAALESRIGRRINTTVGLAFTALAVLVTIYEFIG